MVIKIGYAPGAFDLFHVGHLNILRRSKERCDYLIAGIVSDDLCKSQKGRLPVIPFQERYDIVEQIRFVDKAIAETTPDRLEMWNLLGFNYIFKGSDWAGTDKGRHLENLFTGVAVEVIYLPYTMHTSSTILRNALAPEPQPAPALADSLAAN